MLWKPGTGSHFLITANSLYRQRQLGTNMVVIKRVDCTVMIFAAETKTVFK